MDSQHGAPQRIKNFLTLSVVINCLLIGTAALALGHLDALTTMKARLLNHGGPVHSFTSAHLVRDPLFKSLTNQKVASPLIFFGDSHTEYCPWDELLQTPALNRGIAGETVKDVLDRADDVIRENPRIIVLLVGTNDALEATKLADFSATYSALLHKLHSSLPATVIYIETIPPVLNSGEMTRSVGKMHIEGLNPLIRTMNDKLRSLADGQQLKVLDTYDDLQVNGELRANFTVDGVHLSPAGYAVLKQHLDPILNSPTSR
jgi:lysophospholipase L1-like esterase